MPNQVTIQGSNQTFSGELILTDYGRDRVLQRVAQDTSFEPFNLTEVVIGNRLNNAYNSSITAMGSEIQSFSISNDNISVVDNVCYIRCELDLEGEVTLQEIGVFETINSSRRLFAYASGFSMVKSANVTYDLIVRLELSMAFNNEHYSNYDVVLDDSEYALAPEIDNMWGAIGRFQLDLERCVEANTIKLGYNKAQAYITEHQSIISTLRDTLILGRYEKIINRLGNDNITDCFYYPSNKTRNYKVKNLKDINLDKYVDAVGNYYTYVDQLCRYKYNSLEQIQNVIQQYYDLLKSIVVPEELKDYSEIYVDLSGNYYGLIEQMCGMREVSEKNITDLTAQLKKFLNDYPLPEDGDRDTFVAETNVVDLVEQLLTELEQIYSGGEGDASTYVLENNIIDLIYQISAITGIIPTVRPECIRYLDDVNQNRYEMVTRSGKEGYLNDNGNFVEVFLLDDAIKTNRDINYSQSNIDELIFQMIDLLQARYDTGLKSPNDFVISEEVLKLSEQINEITGFNPGFTSECSAYFEDVNGNLYEYAENNGSIGYYSEYNIFVALYHLDESYITVTDKLQIANRDNIDLSTAASLVYTCTLNSFNREGFILGKCNPNQDEYYFDLRMIYDSSRDTGSLDITTSSAYGLQFTIYSYDSSKVYDVEHGNYDERKLVGHYRIKYFPPTSQLTSLAEDETMFTFVYNGDISNPEIKMYIGTELVNNNEGFIVDNFNYMGPCQDFIKYSTLRNYSQTVSTQFEAPMYYFLPGVENTSIIAFNIALDEDDIEYLSIISRQLNFI